MSATNTIHFKPDTYELIQKIMKRYPEGRHKSALIPVLHIAQAEFGGWLSPETMDLVAETLRLKPIEVYEVASFYTSSCWLSGAEDIMDHLEKRLGIKMGETSADGQFTLRAVECLGSCGTAPMLQVGADYHENLTIEKVDGLLNELKQKDTHSRYC